MDQRQDALLAAAKFVEMVNRVVRANRGAQVGTVGRIQALPGAPNVIPGRVAATLELRDLDDAKIDAAVRADPDGGEEDRRRRRDEVRLPPICTRTSRRRPTRGCARRSPRPRAALGLSHPACMPSGAGHDAQAMAQLGPMGMIFVPSVGGISHSPRSSRSRRTSPTAPTCCSMRCWQRTRDTGGRRRAGFDGVSCALREMEDIVWTVEASCDRPPAP